MLGPAAGGAGKAVVATSLGSFFLLLVASGCRTPCGADEPASKEQIAREQKAVLRGQGICKELVTPTLNLTGESLVLSATRENVLAKRSDLPPKAIHRVDVLHDRLKIYKEHFRAVRAAEPFQPTLYATFDPALELPRAASILATAAYAGYGHMKVQAGAGELITVDWWVGPPERSRIGAGAPPPTALCVGGLGATDYAVWLGQVSSPPKALTGGAERKGPPARVAELIEHLCEGRGGTCADVLVVEEDPGGQSFAVALEVVVAALAAKPFAVHKPPIVLMPASAIVATGPWADPSMKPFVSPCTSSVEALRPPP
jgi:hypothetical protein